MKIVNFIGNYDKMDLILYVAKIVQSAQNSKVLIIDSFDTQKARCIIPALVNDDKYITTFEEIDIAVGFENQKEIVEYMKENDEDFNTYDYVLIDMNTKDMCQKFNSENPNVAFLVVSYDKYDVLKSVSLLNEYIQQRKDFVASMKINKVYVYSVLNGSDEKYIDYGFNELDIKWNNKKIYLPLDEGDLSVIIQNQYVEKIKLRELTSGYKKCILEMATQIMGQEHKSLVSKALKNAERSV